MIVGRGPRALTKPDKEVARLRAEARLLNALAGASCKSGDEDDTGQGHRLSRAPPVVELMNGPSHEMYR